jgi:hypothetical protein
MDMLTMQSTHMMGANPHACGDGQFGMGMPSMQSTHAGDAQGDGDGDEEEEGATRSTPGIRCAERCVRA